MTLAKKGSRRIVVQDEPYRWTLSAQDESGLGIVVEHHDNPGQRLVTWVSHGSVVTPALVRETVLRGLASGWQPATLGPDIWRRLAAVDAPLPAKNACPCCDYLSLNRRGQYDICPICFWEDNGQDIDRLDMHSGPNHMTLREARANFARIGACDEAALAHVLPDEKRARYARVTR